MPAVYKENKKVNRDTIFLNHSFDNNLNTTDSHVNNNTC